MDITKSAEHRQSSPDDTEREHGHWIGYCNWMDIKSAVFRDGKSIGFKITNAMFAWFNLFENIWKQSSHVSQVKWKEYG